MSLSRKVKNIASFLISIIMVASSATSCIILTKSCVSGTAIDVLHEPRLDGPMLVPSEFKLGVESLTRALQNFVCPFNKITDESSFAFVEKIQATFTKVSYKYLFSLQFDHDREEYLFLFLRKLLI